MHLILKLLQMAIQSQISGLFNKLNIAWNDVNEPPEILPKFK